MITKILLLTIGILLVGLFCINEIWNEKLFDASLNLTKKMVELPDFFQHYFWLFSGPVYKITPIFTFLYLALLPEKETVLNSIATFTLSQSFRNLLMVSFRAKRPNWVFIHKLVKCSCGFGNPSGHASGTSVAYGLFFYDFFLKKKHSKITKTVILFLYFFICFNVGLSRIYFGAHTFFQVILGNLYGYFVVLLATKIDPAMSKIYKRCLKNSKKRRMYNLIMFVVTLTIFLLILAGWFLADIYYSDQEKDINTNPYFSGRCDKCFRGRMRFANKNLLGICNGILVSGIYLALFVFKSDYEYFSKHLKIMQYWKIPIRIFILAIPFIFYSIVRTFGKFEIWLNMSLQSFATFFGSFLTIFFYIFIIPCLKLDIIGDIKKFSKTSNEISNQNIEEL